MFIAVCLVVHNILHHAGHGEESGGEVVEVDDAQLVAGLLVVQVGQLGHDLESGGLGFGGVVKVGSALHAQPLAAVVGRADLQVGVVQQLLVGGLVLARAMRRWSLYHMAKPMGRTRGR